MFSRHDVDLNPNKLCMKIKACMSGHKQKILKTFNLVAPRECMRSWS